MHLNPSLTFWAETLARPVFLSRARGPSWPALPHAPPSNLHRRIEIRRQPLPLVAAAQAASSAPSDLNRTARKPSSPFASSSRKPARCRHYRAQELLRRRLFRPFLLTRLHAFKFPPSPRPFGPILFPFPLRQSLHRRRQSRSAFLRATANPRRTRPIKERPGTASLISIQRHHPSLSSPPLALYFRVSSPATEEASAAKFAAVKPSLTL